MRLAGELEANEIIEELEREYSHAEIVSYKQSNKMTGYGYPQYNKMTG